MYNYNLDTLTSKSNRNRDAGKQEIQGMFPSTSYFTSLNLILLPCFFEFLFLFNIYKQFISIFMKTFIDRFMILRVNLLSLELVYLPLALLPSRLLRIASLRSLTPNNFLLASSIILNYLN